MGSKNGWRETTLGEEVDLLTGFPFKSRDYTDNADGIKLLRGDNVVQGDLRWGGVKRWPASDASRYLEYFLEAGDVVLAMDRPWIEAGLKYASISEHDKPCLLVQRVSRLRGGPRLDISFLRYLIGSREFTDHVLAVQTGTSVPHISPTQIKEFAFRCPPLSEQRRIAHILGTFDDKIELNRRMNRTLERMATAIFKSWFIDFDPVHAKAEGGEPGLPKHIAALFPDSFQDSELGPIPEGWEIGPLSKVAALSTTTVQPKAEPEQLWEHYSIPAFDKAQLPQRELGHTIKSGKFVVPHNAVLASKLNPQFPRIWIPGHVDSAISVCSTEFMPFVATRESWRPFLYELLRSPVVQDEIVSHASGSTGSRQRVKPKEVAEMSVLTPPPELIDTFCGMAGGLHEKYIANRTNSKVLAIIRDTLLPKLLSGEIDELVLEQVEVA